MAANAVGAVVGGAAGLAVAGMAETANQYNVYTNNGGKQFKAIEESKRCSWDGMIPTGRACCRPNHALKLHLYQPGKLCAPASGREPFASHIAETASQPTRESTVGTASRRSC